MKRNQTIDLLKVIFVVCIFIGHLNHISLTGEKLKPIMSLGFLGVEFFFCVGGFFMMHKAIWFRENINSTAWESTWKFMIRKISLFFPYYIVSWIIGFCLYQYEYGFNFCIMIKHFFMSIPCILQLQMIGFRCYQVLAPTWYLSAMLISMFIIFPIIYGYREWYSKLIAPFLVVAIYGYLSLKVGNLATINPLKDSFIYTGLLRGIAGVSLGCIVFELSNNINKLNFSVLGRKILTYVEIFIYLFICILMHLRLSIRLDFVIVMLYGIALVITFSNKSYLTNILNIKLNIGNLSLAIFLADANARKITCMMYPDLGRDDRILPAFIILLLLVVINIFIGDFIKNSVGNILLKFRSKLLLNF